MLTTTIFTIILVAATLFIALVAGLLFAFSIVAMPGIKNLNDREFIRAFQEMDGVIQNNQPLFMLVWVGSIFTLLATAGLAFGQLTGLKLMLVIAATVIYLVGVQLPTVTINIPLNNQLQRIHVDQLNGPEQKLAHDNFESRWNQSNRIRTAFASLVSVLLLVLLLMI